MKTFRTFEELQQFVGASGKRRRIVVVKPEDDATREALRLAEEKGLDDIIPIDDQLPERCHRRQPDALLFKQRPVLLHL